MKRGGRLPRRTPLTGGKPLQRTTPPARVTPRRHADRHPGWDRVRQVVWQRSGGRCEKTGAALDPRAWDCHHRLLRSRGGQDTPANAVALHPDAHTAGPDAVHRRVAAATAAGWIVRTGTDPAAVPITMHDGRTVYLDDAGHYLDQPLEAAA